MNEDCWYPWINIYSMPRSVVINREPAREILLSLSLESLATAQPRVRWSRDRDASFTRMRRVCGALVEICACVCVCAGVFVWQDLAGAHRQHQGRNKIWLLFSAAHRPTRNSFKWISVAVNIHYMIFNNSEHWKYDVFYTCISIRIRFQCCTFVPFPKDYKHCLKRQNFWVFSASLVFQPQTITAALKVYPARMHFWHK